MEQRSNGGSLPDILYQDFAYFFPGGSRSYLARPLADGTAAGKEHGAPRPTPRAGQGPAPRGNCVTQFPVCVEPTNVTVGR